MPHRLGAPIEWIRRPPIFPYFKADAEYVAFRPEYPVQPLMEGKNSFLFFLFWASPINGADVISLCPESETWKLNLKHFNFDAANELSGGYLSDRSTALWASRWTDRYFYRWIIKQVNLAEWHWLGAYIWIFLGWKDKEMALAIGKQK